MVLEPHAKAGVGKHTKIVQGIHEGWFILLKHTETHKHLLLLEIKGS